MCFNVDPRISIPGHGEGITMSGPTNPVSIETKSLAPMCPSSVVHVWFLLVLIQSIGWCPNQLHLFRRPTLPTPFQLSGPSFALSVRNVFLETSDLPLCSDSVARGGCRNASREFADSVLSRENQVNCRLLLLVGAFFVLRGRWAGFGDNCAATCEDGRRQDAVRRPRQLLRFPDDVNCASICHCRHMIKYEHHQLQVIIMMPVTARGTSRTTHLGHDRARE